MEANPGMSPEQALLDELNRCVEAHHGRVTIARQQLAQEVPHLSALLLESLEVVNAASSIDRTVGLPDRVELHSGSGNMQVEIRPLTDDTALRLDPNRLRSIGLSAFRGEIEHEMGHLAQHKNHPVLNFLGAMQSALPGSEANKPFELEADRYADATAMLENLLLTAAKRPNEFDGQHSLSLTHPSERQRVSALLDEVYGNAAFGMHGRFAGSGRDGYEFMPARDADGFPVNESGQIVLNWDSTLQPAIARQRERDLEKLDL